jgi:hypothetical protein
MRRRVPRAKYDEAVMLYLRERRRRLDVEEKLGEKDAAIRQMQGLVQHQRDQQPDAPLPYQPARGEARLQQLLALSEKARRALDADRSELITANVELTREVRELREALAAATAPGPTVTYDGRPA